VAGCAWIWDVVFDRPVFVGLTSLGFLFVVADPPWSVLPVVYLLAGLHQAKKPWQFQSPKPASPSRAGDS
jgi:hypothetical protein